MNCKDCKKEMETVETWRVLCKPCYIVNKKKEKFNFCPDCSQYNIKKESDYITCYDCNQSRYLSSKHSNPLENFAFTSK